jgi:hypothetical protein
MTACPRCRFLLMPGRSAFAAPFPLNAGFVAPEAAGGGLESGRGGPPAGGELHERPEALRAKRPHLVAGLVQFDPVRHGEASSVDRVQCPAERSGDQRKYGRASH